MSINAWVIVLSLTVVCIGGVIVFLAQFRTRRTTAMLALVIAMFATLALCGLTFLGGAFQTKPLGDKRDLGGFPFPVGTTWIYSRVQYDPMIGDPTQTMTATNLITETVVRAEGVFPNQEFLHRQTASLVSAPPGWRDNSSNFNRESWYRIDGTRIFSSPEGFRQINTLVYEFPFVVGKSWCPQPPPAVNPACMSMGRRTVQSRTTYTTPTGSFDECYELSQDFNSGGVTEWFCNGVGVVARKYDHAGTRFGFADTLVGFSMGSPPR